LQGRGPLIKGKGRNIQVKDLKSKIAQIRWQPRGVVPLDSYDAGWGSKLGRLEEVRKKFGVVKL